MPQQPPHAIASDQQAITPVGKRGCSKRKKSGELCGGPAIQGADRCRMHAGKSVAKVRAEVAVRREAAAWGLGDAKVDPGEVLLRLVSQSAARCELYARLLEEAYEAAERLREAHAAQALITNLHADDDPEYEDPPAVQTAKADLDRIFNVGGVAALIGYTYSVTNSGSTFATGEQLRGLAKLEADERQRCAGFAAKAIAAGLAERQVRIAERHASQLVKVMHAVLVQLGHDPNAPVVRDIITRELRVILGDKAA